MTWAGALLTVTNVDFTADLSGDDGTDFEAGTPAEATDAKRATATPKHGTALRKTDGLESMMGGWGGGDGERREVCGRQVATDAVRKPCNCEWLYFGSSHSA